MNKILSILAALFLSVTPAWGAVADSTSRAQYNCNSSATVFAFTFNAGSEAEVRVLRTVTSTGTETALVAGTDYTVSCTNDDCFQGGTVTTVATCATGGTITILRDVSVTQETDYTEGMPTLYESLETDLDHQTRINQQQDEELRRAVKLLPSSSLAEPNLPNPAAGYAIGWNNSGTGLANISTGGLTVPDLDFVGFYADLAEAVSVIGSSPKTLIVNQLTTLDADDDITVPETMTLLFLRDGSVDLSSGALLTIYGGIVNPDDHQIFTVPLSATAAASALKIRDANGTTSCSPHVPYISPNWFDETEANDIGNKINKAFQVGGAFTNVMVPRGVNTVKNTVNVDSDKYGPSLTLAGYGYRTSWLQAEANSAICIVNAALSDECEIKDVLVQEAAPNTKTCIGIQEGGTSLKVHDTWVSSCLYGHYQNRGAGTRLYNNFSENSNRNWFIAPNHDSGITGATVSAGGITDIKDTGSMYNSGVDSVYFLRAGSNGLTDVALENVTIKQATNTGLTITDTTGQLAPGIRGVTLSAPSIFDNGTSGDYGAIINSAEVTLLGGNVSNNVSTGIGASGTAWVDVIGTKFNPTKSITQTADVAVISGSPTITTDRSRMNSAKGRLISEVYSIITPANVRAFWIFDADGTVQAITDRNTIGGGTAHPVTLRDETLAAQNAINYLPQIQGQAPTMHMSATALWDTPDAADLSFTAGQAFSLVALYKPGGIGTTQDIIAKVDVTTGATQLEYQLFLTTNPQLWFRCFDDSAGANITRRGGTLPAREDASFHTYIGTKSTADNVGALKTYRDGVQNDTTSVTSGVFTAIDDKAAVVGSYEISAAGAVATPSLGQTSVIIIIAAELSQTEVSRLDAALRTFAGSAL